MRNFEERKAEVFRRSENRIKERKRNRNRILALCIPLCLVLTICSVTILPAMRPFEGDKAENENPGTISDEAVGTDGASNHSFVLVDVKGTGAQAQHHCAISDAPGVNAVFEQLYRILIPHESHSDLVGALSDGAVCVPDGDGSEELMDFANETKASGYIITMTSANGVKRTFELTGNKLNDVELHMEIELTDEQISSLKSALGLTD